METKSRYEVISDLEQQKRKLIIERDSLNDSLLAKKKLITQTEREKNDNIIEYDRQIADLQEELANFEKTLAERKETIKELIKSIDDSLERFSKLQQKKEKE